MGDGRGAGRRARIACDQARVVLAIVAGWSCGDGVRHVQVASFKLRQRVSEWRAAHHFEKKAGRATVVVRFGSSPWAGPDRAVHAKDKGRVTMDACLGFSGKPPFPCGDSARRRQGEGLPTEIDPSREILIPSP